MPSFQDPQSFLPFFFFNVFFFLATLGLHCCVQAFAAAARGGDSLVAGRRLLLAVASLVAEHRLQGGQEVLSSYSTQA